MGDITPGTGAALHPIRVAREAQDLSREGLAFKAGVSFKAIERIETGRTKTPHRATLQAIAAALELEPDDLLPQEAAA
jgi:transcriptional regulator with XRE-family HTH domain